VNTNEQLIHDFYNSFKSKDYKAMQACYDDRATFSDAVFEGLTATETRAMWEMLIKSGKDLSLDFENIWADDKSGRAEWVAHYTFSRTGRKVTNHIKAEFLFQSGKIIQHKDHFNFYRWASQALGLPGILLGWTPFIRNKVRAAAMKNLVSFLQTRKN